MNLAPPATMETTPSAQAGSPDSRGVGDCLVYIHIYMAYHEKLDELGFLVE